MKLQTYGTVLVGLVVCGCLPGSSREGINVLEVGSNDIQAVTSEARFVSVRDMVLDSGAVWVLDGAPPFLSRVAWADGGTLQFGVEGQGPGELLNPWAIQSEPGPGGPGIRVWDMGTHRVSLFDTLGGLETSESLSEEGMIRARADIRSVSYADPFRVRSEGNTTLVGDFPRRLDRTGDIAAGSLRRADHRLTPGSPLVRFADHVEGGAPSQLEWMGVPLWDLCDGAVALWSPATAQVIWMDLDGNKLGGVPVEGVSTEIDLEDIEAYLKWMGRLELGPDHDEAGINYARMARASRDRFAERVPGATDLRCEAKGVAWLRLFDTSVDPLGRGQTWLRVSERGDSRRYRFPDGFTPMVFAGQGAYGVLEVPEGYQVLAWWNGETVESK
ncbi:MAG: hypothetical protein E4G90_08885 [Gemmatimonadales bacterium]|nr:MAG: hypothetical protein E4G90_08885 [Gemmatimonadales bacterium]